MAGAKAPAVFFGARPGGSSPGGAMPTVTTVGFFLAWGGTEPMSLWRVPPQPIAWSGGAHTLLTSAFSPGSSSFTHFLG